MEHLDDYPSNFGTALHAILGSPVEAGPCYVHTFAIAVETRWPWWRRLLARLRGYRQRDVWQPIGYTLTDRP